MQIKIKDDRGCLKGICYSEIPAGVVFAYVIDVELLSTDNAISMYLKGCDGMSMVLSMGHMGAILEEDDFNTDPVWYVLDTTLTVNI